MQIDKLLSKIKKLKRSDPIVRVFAVIAIVLLVLTSFLPYFLK